MNLNFIGLFFLFLSVKASDAFWEIIFAQMWEWLFAQIDWQSLTRKIQLNLLVLYLDWLLC